MYLLGVKYHAKKHASAKTDDFIFTQLIAYLGSKRKLLPLIEQALHGLDISQNPTFLDLFAGSGVVSRFAKTLGFRVISNDLESYSYAINHCFISSNKPPAFEKLGGYEATIAILNALEGVEGWVFTNLCPATNQYNPNCERAFFTPYNGKRIDAIRQKICDWRIAGVINDIEEACLIAPLIFQASYCSNTSGHFKSFHSNWGGSKGDALSRIQSELHLKPAVFFDNELENIVFQKDAITLASSLETVDVAYLDPPYNQHAYAANYHALNSVAKWDKPAVSPKIKRGTKSAIRDDAKASIFNKKNESAKAYQDLLQTINARYILTSYSTDGIISLKLLIATNLKLGYVSVVINPYTRYQTSSQRPTNKPINIEFILVTDTHNKSISQSTTHIIETILKEERVAIRAWYRSSNRKWKGSANVPSGLPLAERQSLGGKHGRSSQKEETELLIIKAVADLKSKGIKLGATKIARAIHRNRRTVNNYRHLWDISSM